VSIDPLRLEDLISRHFDGTLDADEEAEFAAALAASAEARARLASYMRVEGALSQLGVAGLVERPARSTRRLRRVPGENPRAWGWALAAAAAAGFLILLMSGLSTHDRETRTAGRRPVRPAPEEPAKAPDPAQPAAQPAVPHPTPPSLLPTPVQPVPAPPDPRPSTPPAPKETVPVPEKPKDPDRAPVPATEAVVARLVEGEGAPLDLRAGQGVETRAGATAAILFPDRTRLEVGASSVLRGLGDDTAGKRAHLESGSLAADVARQPQGRAFVLTTPQAEIRVLGTKFTLSVSADTTRLEVTEGRVRLTRLADKRSVDVTAGQFALAAPGAPPRVRPLPIDEIVLYPAQGQLTGSEWRPIKDEKALDGLLLEADDTANQPIRRLPIDAAKVNSWFAQGRSRSWVSFTFDAEAGKDYRVWVRGRCVAKADRITSDSVMMEVANGRFVDRPADWHPYSDYLCSFDGYGNAEGFSWSGGFFDPARTQKPIGLRFNAPGKQLIRVHAMETPIQIDAIWITTTQTRRPDPEQRPGRK
jgi:ferric-dicitrate binding protein FerR (iron transport regulator)